MSRISAVAAALMFCSLPLTVTYTSAFEVFSLNNLICSCLLYLTIRITSKYNEIQCTYIGAVVVGLGLSNQHTSILFAIPLVLLVLSQKPITVQLVIKSSICFTLGLLPYLLLLFSDTHAGSWGDTTNIQGLFKHFFRREYGTFRLSPNDFKHMEGFMERNVQFMYDTLEQYQPNGLPVPFAFIGILSSFRCNRKLSLTIVLAFVFYFSVFHSLANLPLDQPMSREVHRRFWIQPNLLIR